MGTLRYLIAVIFLTVLAACGGDKSANPAAAVSEPASEKVGEEGTESGAAKADPAKADPAVVAIYNRACISCHLSGAAGAPKTHDVAAWEPRLAKGMDAMLANIKKGLNAMPPKGLCFDCSDEDYRAVTLFMASPK